MRSIINTVALAVLISLPISNARASITTTQNGTVTAIYGSGNPNVWDQVVTYSGGDGDLQLALNTHINPNNGNLNVDFSVNVSPDGLGGTLVSDSYSYYLYVNNNSASTLDLTLIPDNQYGTSATPNGGGAKTTWANRPSSDYIFQNSEPVASVIDAYFGVSNPTSYTLEVVGGNGSVYTDTISVPSPVPEPTTVVAGLMLLVPLCFGALRTLRKGNERPKAMASID